MSARSAGILVYKREAGVLQVMLVHPGGPFWVNKDDGAWSIPKGLYEPGEEPLEAAKREFTEETGFQLTGGEFIDLGELRQPSGKIVRVWAAAGDFDAARLVSNTFPLEWPRGSGNIEEVPEVDRAQWYEMETAAVKITKGQRGFLERLRRALAGEQEGDG